MDQEIKRAGYENIYVDCPYCEKENIYNRIDDLHTSETIDRKDGITCSHCNKIYAILGDRIKLPKYQWFLEELEILEQNKHYMQYILFLCQACEAFFEQAIINRRLDQNNELRDDDGYLDPDKYHIELDKLNNSIIYDLCGEGSKKTIFIKASFDQLRMIFLYDFITTDDVKFNYNLNIIKKTAINKTRNKVIHKMAYRPILSEIKSFDSLIDAIYFFKNMLRIDLSSNILNDKIST